MVFVPFLDIVQKIGWVSCPRTQSVIHNLGLMENFFFKFPFEEILRTQMIHNNLFRKNNMQYLVKSVHFHLEAELFN